MPVTALGHGEDDTIGLSRIVLYGDCFMPVGIEGPSPVGGGFDTVLCEQLAQLLKLKLKLPGGPCTISLKLKFTF